MSALREFQEMPWDRGSRQAEASGVPVWAGGLECTVSMIISPDQAARSPKHHAFLTRGQDRAGHW